MQALSVSADPGGSQCLGKTEGVQIENSSATHPEPLSLPDTAPVRS